MFLPFLACPGVQIENRLDSRLRWNDRVIVRPFPQRGYHAGFIIDKIRGIR